MKRHWSIQIACIIFSVSVAAQNIGIGTTAPDASARLDISGNNKGLLIPRIALSGTGDVTTIAAPAASLLVYNTVIAGTSPNNVYPGFYFWDGVRWISLSGGTGGNDWGLLGNAGINPANNFIGTTDDHDLIFKRNNIRSGRIGLTNTSFGLSALPANTTGTNNTAFGLNALFSNTVGNSNTACGAGSLATNAAGIRNTAIGVNSLAFNNGGSDNTASGTASLYSNTTGQLNTANGVNSLFSNTTGGGNTANGYNSLYSNTTGQLNTATGLYALASNTTGNNNTAIGADALNANSTGSGNTANGANALYSNTTGFNNTAAGADALFHNTSGIFNTATGHSTLKNNTTGILNTAAGFFSLMVNTTGNSNTAFGASALGNNTTGQNNTAVGNDALVSNIAGTGNTSLGHNTGTINTTGNNNTAVGYNANFGASNLTNATAIGANAIVNTSNSLVLGNSVNIGIGTSSPLYTLDVAGTIKADAFKLPANAVNGAVLTSDAQGNGTWTANEKVFFKANGFQYNFNVLPYAGPGSNNTRILRDWTGISINIGSYIYNNGSGEYFILLPGIYRITAKVHTTFNNPDSEASHELQILLNGGAIAAAESHVHHSNALSNHAFVTTISSLTQGSIISIRYRNWSTTASAQFLSLLTDYLDEFTVEKID